MKIASFLIGIVIALGLWSVLVYINPSPSIDNPPEAIKVGINASPSMAELESVGVPPITMDFTKHGRPFKEVNTDLVYNDKGYPILKQGDKAVFITLSGYTKAFMPEAPLYVLYETNKGKIEYQGYGKLIKSEVIKNNLNILTHIDKIELSFNEFNNKNKLNQLRLILKDDTINNIRITQIGGYCLNNIQQHVINNSYCKDNNYIDFKDHYLNNDTPLFNPNYIRYYRQFTHIRYMNLQQTSPSVNACYREGSFNQTCLNKKISNSQFPKLTDVTWGGTHKTNRLDRIGQGLPLEILVNLINALDIHPWIVIPHNADDDYIIALARALDRISPHLTTYVEYSNETWNGTYLAHHYLKLKTDNSDKYGLAKAYVRETTRVHNLWRKTANKPFKRVISGYQGDPSLSKVLLENGVFDVLAIGGYYYGCFKVNNVCKEQDLLTNETTVENIVRRLRDVNNPYGVPALYALWDKHNKIAKANNTILAIYEGGPHLTINWSSDKVKDLHQLDLYRQTINSPYMYKLSTEVMNHWYSHYNGPFLFFTGPEGEHKYWVGTFTPSIF